MLQVPIPVIFMVCMKYGGTCPGPSQNVKQVAYSRLHASKYDDVSSIIPKKLNFPWLLSPLTKGGWELTLSPLDSSTDCVHLGTDIERSYKSLVWKNQSGKGAEAYKIWSAAVGHELPLLHTIVRNCKNDENGLEVCALLLWWRIKKMFF